MYVVVCLEVIPKGARTLAWYKNDTRVLFDDLRGAESAWLDVLEGVVQGTEDPNFESWHRLLVRESIFLQREFMGM